MLLYSVLHLTGYEEMSIDQLKRFRVLGSITHGHPERRLSAGIETTTGPLGQGIGNAVGMAVAERILNARFGDALVDHATYAYLGDGCLMEGIAAEVIALAGHLRLGRLTFLWDDNRMTDDGPTDQAMSEDIRAIFAANQWHVQSVDGHDPVAVSTALDRAKADPRPSMIACRTVIGYGMPRIEDTRAAHGGTISAEDAQEARERLGWTAPPFVLPEPIRAAWLEAGQRGEAARAAWQARFNALREGERAEFVRVMAGNLPGNWMRELEALRASFRNDSAERAGTQSSGESLATLSGILPELVSGAPDLEAATKHKQNLRPFTREDRGGRYIHYGVREHAMGAMMNGMALHGGLQVVGATFLAFSDYMRHTIRMAALMGLPVRYFFSHDSIGLGKGGPTHQPVEHLASLRAIPNLLTLRPADAVEMTEAWQVAFARREGPSAIIGARQALPLLRREAGGENLTAKGAYILADAKGGARRATLLATGSEVAEALKARDLLQGRGVPTAVISMPCWEIFDAQSRDYREHVLGPDTVRVGVEAAVRLGWDRYIGPEGGFVGMSGFGASADHKDLYRHFGITPEAAMAAVLKRL